MFLIYFKTMPSSFQKKQSVVLLLPCILDDSCCYTNTLQSIWYISHYHDCVDDSVCLSFHLMHSIHTYTNTYLHTQSNEKTFTGLMKSCFVVVVCLFLLSPNEITFISL